MKDKGHLAFLEQSFQRDFFALLILQLEGWCLRTDFETRNLLPQTGRRHGKSYNQCKEATPGNSLHGNFVSPKQIDTACYRRCTRRTQRINSWIEDIDGPLAISPVTICR
jgi:hypothetical protein